MTLEFRTQVQTSKKPKCSKGYPCGGGCISRQRNCKKPLQGQAASFANWLKLQGEKAPGAKTPKKNQAVAVNKTAKPTEQKPKQKAAKQDTPSKPAKPTSERSPLSRLDSASEFQLKDPAFLAEVGREFAEKYLVGTKKEAKAEFNNKIASLNKQKEALNEEIVSLLSSSTTSREEAAKNMSRVNEIDGLLGSLEQEISKTLRTDPPSTKAQFAKLRGAIVARHDLSKSQVDKLVKSVNRRGLSKVAMAESTEVLSEIVALSGRKPQTFDRLITFDKKKNVGDLLDQDGNRNVKRAYASEYKKSINMGQHFDEIPIARFRNGDEGEKEARLQAKTSMYHEFAHHLEFTDPTSQQAVNNWINRRTQGETAKKLSEITGNKNYNDDEIAKPDAFVSPYIGKINQGNEHTEALSMGVQEFVNEEEMKKFHAMDQEHFYLTLGILLKKS